MLSIYIYNTVLAVIILIIRYIRTSFVNMNNAVANGNSVVFVGVGKNKMIYFRFKSYNK